MYKKKHFKSPDIKKLQAVKIDRKTTIYIALGANPEESKKRYFIRNNNPETIVLS